MTQTKKCSGLDLDVVRQLADVLAESGLTEIEYDTGGWRVRVARAPAAQAYPALGAVVTQAASSVGGKELAPRSEAEAFADHPGLLTSPMVGVVYISTEPESPPFARVGDQVAVGDTVLLIEAMKVFNPIKAHCSGRIKRVLVTSGMPVEYGEPLLLIV